MGTTSSCDGTSKTVASNKVTGPTGSELGDARTPCHRRLARSAFCATAIQLAIQSDSYSCNAEFPGIIHQQFDSDLCLRNTGRIPESSTETFGVKFSGCRQLLIRRNASEGDTLSLSSKFGCRQFGSFTPCRFCSRIQCHDFSLPPRPKEIACG